VFVFFIVARGKTVILYYCRCCLLANKTDNFAEAVYSNNSNQQFADVEDAMTNINQNFAGVEDAIL
jgi:hypothetical protein